MLIIAKEEKLEREINSKPISIKESRTFVKEQDPLELLIKKFDELSVNLLNKESKMAYPNTEAITKNNWYQNRSYERCTICSRNGHRTEQCSYKKSPPIESNNKSIDSAQKQPVRSQEVSCLEIEVEKTVDYDCFAAEKRNLTTETPDKNKRPKVFETSPSEDAYRPRIQERRPQEIKLSETTIPYSISKNLSETKAELSISQLLQVAPSIRKELMGLCRKVETKEINELDLGEPNNTNCRGLITIFNKKYWAVLDTGAACSVISDKLMEELGLEVDQNSDQIIVTADGTRHNTMGTISSVPISIANYKFPCDVLVLKIDKPILILGTDWFNKFDAILDIESKELILEALAVGVVIKLYINTPNRRVYEEVEVFGVAVEKEYQKPEKTPAEFEKLQSTFNGLFVENLSESLKQRQRSTQ
ncbi:hypothetical protein AYI70_g3633 [Smittium culicis]|uniref:DNA damage-inducible protein 1 n=1 Tax=Smittium culicis TaxID=133412 RepID=A0A1R1Y2V5_9FUNG|nr:hypothetical protein AYI70_g3633 [Smittium culicis]